MHTNAIGTKMNRLAVISMSFLSLMVVLLPVFSSADEKIAGRIVHHSVKTEKIDVGDIPGHIIGISQQSGLTFYTTGEIGTSTNNAYFDYVNGKGTFTSYRVHTFQDGSTLTVKSAGTATPVDGGKRTVFEGPAECIGGTGRFEGFKGTGTFKGERIGSLITGADAYIDFTLNCMKP